MRYLKLTQCRGFAMAVIGLSVAAFSLTACNTTAGIGKDASAAGQAVTKEADKIKDKM